MIYEHLEHGVMNIENYIKEHFHYDYETGLLSRDDRKGGLGSLDTDGYIILKIKGKQFKYHRVVWLLCNGEFPQKELDHIDRNKLNNRIENLREVDSWQNNLNKEPIINKDTGEEHIYLDTTTKGLKAKYTVRRGNACRRFRTLEDAKKYRDVLWEGAETWRSII